jgi:hypothetical protein
MVFSPARAQSICGMLAAAFLRLLRVPCVPEKLCRRAERDSEQHGTWVPTTGVAGLFSAVVSRLKTDVRRPGAWESGKRQRQVPGSMNRARRVKGAEC